MMTSTIALLPTSHFQLSEISAMSGEKKIDKAFSPSDLKNTIAGRIIDLDNAAGHPDLKLAFYSRGYFGLIPLGSARTGSEGRFTFKCNLISSYFSKTTDLIIKVINDVEAIPGLNYPFIKVGIPVDEIKLKVDASESNIELGTLTTKVDDIPTDLSNVPDPLPSQLPDLRYFLNFAYAAGFELPKKLFVSTFVNYLTASQVQKIYDFTLFGLLGKSYPKVELTKEMLFEELQNRICHSDYRIENNKIIFSTDWNETDFIRSDSLAHMQVVFNILPAGVELDFISRRYPDETEATIIRNGDSAFSKALKDAFNNFAYDGEGQYHLGCGHMVTVVPALTKDAHLSESNPIAKVLAPHVKGTVFINNLGKKGIIFGQGGVLSNSAYSINGVNKFILGAAASKANWQNYMPLAPISISDRRSRAEAICFKVYQKYFKEFIDNNRDEIGKYWIEIYNWSQHMNSLMPTLPTITTVSKNPTEEDLANLAKFCAWIVNISTFIHWAAHSRQQILTDISQASVAVRNKGYKENGEVDPFNGTTAEDANTQLFISRFLLAFKEPGIFNHPQLVDPLLISCFKERISDLKALYPDFENMFVTVDI